MLVAKKLATKKMFLVSTVSLALLSMLSGCQVGKSATTISAAVQPLSVNASHYHKVQLAGQDYQLFTTSTSLQIRQGNRELAQQAGQFSRLVLQPLDTDALLLAAMDVNSNSLFLWRFSPEQTPKLQLLQRQLISSRVVDDLCFYHSTENQQLSLFLMGGRGGADQLLLQQQQQWLATPLVIRELNIPYDSTACSVDQQSGALYIAEADRAIWRYQAEPEADEGRSLVQVNKPFGQLQGEVKALQLLSDGSLLALEEQPARLLHLSANGELLTTAAVTALGEASGLAVQQQAKSVTAFISSEQVDAVQQLTLSVPAPVPANTERNIKAAMVQLMPTLQTDAASQRGDVIDDPAVWHHPSAPARSLILATDKRAGLDVYNMQGKRVQQLSVGRLNNVDVRYGLTWKGAQHDIAVASLRDDNSLQLFAIDSSGKLHNAGKVATNMVDIYGLCMYQSGKTGQQFVFVNDKSGLIQQYRIDTNGHAWQGSLVRSLQLPSQPEGCVADDQTGVLFVGEEDAGIWRFAAEPDATEAGEQIILVDGETLIDDVEGLALATHGDNQYLIASSQGNDSYVVYDAAAPYAIRLHLRVSTNPQLAIDGSSETDGLEVTTRSLGPGFEQGALIVQDGRNRMPEQGQNLKLVPWADILQQLN